MGGGGGGGENNITARFSNKERKIWKIKIEWN